MEGGYSDTDLEDQDFLAESNTDSSTETSSESTVTESIDSTSDLVSVEKVMGIYGETKIPDIHIRSDLRRISMLSLRRTASRNMKLSFIKCLFIGLGIPVRVRVT